MLHSSTILAHCLTPSLSLLSLHAALPPLSPFFYRHLRCCSSGAPRSRVLATRECAGAAVLPWLQSGPDGLVSVRRRRIYLPMDELVEAVLIEEDIFRGKVTDKWRRIMKGQIQRAMLFFDEAEKGGPHLDCKQMAVSSISVAVQADLGRLKRQILDAIEANDYNNFTKRAYVGKAKKLLSLPVAYARAAVA